MDTKKGALPAKIKDIREQLLKNADEKPTYSVRVEFGDTDPKTGAAVEDLMATHSVYTRKSY